MIMTHQQSTEKNRAVCLEAMHCVATQSIYTSCGHTLLVPQSHLYNKLLFNFFDEGLYTREHTYCCPG